jgi:hypothetical protein
MGVFDFTKYVVKEDKVYCTDAEGDIYEVSFPKKIPVSDCPACVIKMFLAQKDRGDAVCGT